jgi:hypothetical protein
MGAFLKKNQSPVEGVGWIFYFFLMLFTLSLYCGYKSGPLLPASLSRRIFNFQSFHIICVYNSCFVENILTEQVQDNEMDRK